jgi:alkanesulfonate monooxygenase SsuD/methylene tetrahydromethanopterin reductase-like flavin-dependent oxidoreductase (luciferase family)
MNQRRLPVDIAIGLPNTVPGTEGRTLIDWARNAEQAGFSSLGTIGRLVYPNYEELTALSAAAAVTSRIRLTTAVLLAPLYTNHALLAKQAASLDRLSGGRLVLGLGLGGRDDDFAASGLTTEGRGRRLEEQLAVMKRVWSGEKFGMAGGIGPEPARPGGPEIILGGTSDASFRRVARLADGWIMGGGTPDMFAQAATAVDQAWQEAGRPGRPRKLSLAYFALGSDARAQADGYIRDYYAFLGDIAEQIAAGAAISPEMVKSYIAAFGSAGCDELIFVPTASSLDQVDLLADAAR